jgi:hypothetical protein
MDITVSHFLSLWWPLVRYNGPQHNSLSLNGVQWTLGRLMLHWSPPTSDGLQWLSYAAQAHCTPVGTIEYLASFREFHGERSLLPISWKA